MQHCLSIFIHYSINVFDQQNINNFSFNDFSINSINCKFIRGRMVSQRKAQQESLSKLSDLIQEDLSGISAIKIYALKMLRRKNLIFITMHIEIRQ